MRDVINQDEMTLSDPLPLKPLSGHLNTTYKRFVLVTTPRQLSGLGPTDEDTLVVSCDWLLWQKEAANGRHCVFYELGLLEWDEPNDMASNLYLHSHDWLHELPADPTVFHGVSLGNMLSADISNCLMSYHRIHRSLEGLISLFSPEEVHFFGFQNDINVLPRELQAQIVAAIADENGLTFTDMLSGSGLLEDIGDVADRPSVLGNTPTPFAKRAALGAYTYVLEVLSMIRSAIAHRGRNRVLLQLNTKVMQALLDSYDTSPFSNQVQPIVSSRTAPKQTKSIIKGLLGGIFYARPRSGSLSSSQRQSLAVIRADLNTLLSQQDVSIETAIVHAYIRETVLDTDVLEQLAETVISAERMLRSFRPDRIVVDGVRNAGHRAYMELAKSAGAKVDYIWHSPFLSSRLRMDALGGDPRTEPLVDRCLSWGQLNDAWLENIEAYQPRVRVGSPLSARYQIAETSQVPDHSERKNAVILQYTPQIQDLTGLNTNMYEFTLRSIRVLKEAGFKNIRFKLHPGRDRWKKEYFEAIMKHWDMDVKVLKSEPLHENIVWADVLIGPIQSSSVYESLAAGKPYFPFLIPPTFTIADSFGNFPLIASLDDLENSLENWHWEPANELVQGVTDPDCTNGFWGAFAAVSNPIASMKTN